MWENGKDSMIYIFLGQSFCSTTSDVDKDYKMSWKPSVYKNFIYEHVVILFRKSNI